MSPDPGEGMAPPRFLRALLRALIRGPDASFITADLDGSFVRDLERGERRSRAVRRYAWNGVGSIGAVWAAALRRAVTHGIGLDAKLGVRMLARQPLITIVAVFTLGLGIPAPLGLLHAVDVLFSDLPVPEGHRLVGVRHFDVAVRDPVQASLHDLERWSDLRSLQSIGAVRSYPVNFDGAESGAPPVLAAELTASSFEVLRVQPVRGRALVAGDELDGAPDVVVIGEDLWEARFGRDPDIVGRSVSVGRAPHTVIGVMPADFRFPLSHQLWLPSRTRAADVPLGAGPRVLVFGRLADGVSIQDARVELAELTARRASDDPERFERLVGEVVGMATLLLEADAEDAGTSRQTEVMFAQILAFGLLLVVCGNVGTLVLARTAARASEITIRTALGAGRTRILGQLFIEALVLVMTATGLGLMAAQAFATWFTRSMAPYTLLPYWVDFGFTPRIVAIALGLAVLCAVVAGVLPAIPTTRRAIRANLQRAGAGHGSISFGIGSSVLIVSQIVLSVGFLALGATRVRSAFVYGGEDLGFDPDRYVFATLAVPEIDATEAIDATASDSLAWRVRLAETQRTLLEALNDDPSVLGVAMGADVPGLTSANRTVILETPPAGFEPVEWDVSIPYVDVAFFSGLGRPILAGRDFNIDDAARDLSVDGPLSPATVNDGVRGPSHDVVIVNESFVRHYLGDRSAVGQRLRYAPQGRTIGDHDDPQWYEIVGVVGAFGTNPENTARDAAIYHPLAPGEINPIWYTVEVAGDPEEFLPRFRRIAASVDPTALVSEVRPLAAAIRTQSLLNRSIFLLLLVGAGAAFLLSATGIYALMSFTVAQRTREIGIRSALGADVRDIVATVGRRAALQAGVGLALGAAWGWWLLNSSRTDVNLEVGNIPLTLALTTGAAGAVCVVACTRPLARGLRIQPTEALRES